MPKLPLRFSLATLLLLTTIVCLAAALWSSTHQLMQTRRRLEAATNQIQQYRNEAGILTISDPEKLHVVKMPLYAELQWQWRVRVPAANGFGIQVGTGMIPKEGRDGVRGGGTLVLPAGETIVHASIYRDYRGELVFRTYAGGNSFKTELKEGQADWLNTSGWNTTAAGSNGTETTNPGQSMVLLRFRATEQIETQNDDGTVSTACRVSDEPTPGLMAWISDSRELAEEEAKSSAAAESP